MSGGAAWLPVVARIAMPLGQSTVYSYAAPRPRDATEPEHTVRRVAASLATRHSTRGNLTPGRQKSLKCTLSGAACRLRRWDVPSWLTCVSSDCCGGWLMARCHPGLFSVGHRVMRLFSADTAIVSIAPRQGGAKPCTKPAAVCSLASDWDARGGPHRGVSTRTPQSAVRRAASNRVPGPNCPVHDGVDTDASTLAAPRVKDAGSKPLACRQFPGGLPPSWCHGDTGFFRHHEDVSRL